MKQAWSVTEVARLLGLSVEATRALARDVFEGPRDLFAYSDLSVMRAARGAGSATEQALSQELAQVTTQQIGRETVVVRGRQRWNAESGQTLLDFGTPAPRTSWLRPRSSREAQPLFEAALAMEERNGAAAIDAYAEALAVDPHHADAHINLGRLLHQAGRLLEAEAHYVAALVARPTDVLATFNLAVVLEDLGRLDDAIARYRETIELDPAHVDAYFNLSRLYEKKGEKAAALRHLRDYRRLTGPTRA